MPESGQTGEDDCLTPIGRRGGDFSGSVAVMPGCLVGAVVLVAARLRPPGGPIIQGVVAGLGFGLTALSVRGIATLAPAGLVRDPAAYAAAVSGACAFVSFAAGLQRGAVASVSALVIVGETTLPAVTGIVLWHDRTRPGWTSAALAGFTLAVAGALLLARFAEPDAVTAD